MTANGNLQTRNLQSTVNNGVLITDVFEYEDRTSEDAVPITDEYYAFLNYRRGSRGRMAILNEEIFIITSQNGIISGLLIFFWVTTQFLNKFCETSTVTKIFGKITRLGMAIFFIKFIFIAVSELAIHDVVRPQPFKFRLSWVLSLVILQIYLIELIRAYNVVSKIWTKETLGAASYNK